MTTFLKLSVIVLAEVLICTLIYLADSKTPFGRIHPRVKQLIIGVIFGGIAIMGTEFGVNVGTAVTNVRDAAPLCAGLIFGPTAGIIAGIIGGVERWFAVYWGAGAYTQLACSVSTVLAGFFGAALSKYMFDRKKPSFYYGFAIGVVMEILHMLMIFVTNMNDVHNAFLVVKTCSLPMILSNGIAVMLSLLVISLISDKPKIKSHGDLKKISQTFQRWLLVCIVTAYVVTSVFTGVLQTRLSVSNATDLLRLNISDVRTAIQDTSDKNLLSLTHTITNELNAADQITGELLTSLADTYDVAEINIVDQNGIISLSTNSDFIGFDMNSGKQSSVFLVLLRGTSEYVQNYQPMTYDPSISRKYAGVALQNGGFVQVGYDAAHFQKDMLSQMVNAAHNRHVGTNGFVMICDANLKIVSNSKNSEGDTLSSAGMNLDTLNANEDTQFTTTVYGESSYCMYTVSEGYYIFSVLPESEVIFSRDLSVYISVFMEIVVFAILFTLIYFLIKTLIVDNIHKINGSLSQITSGNLNVTVDVRENEEFASLSDDINTTVVTLKQYIADAASRIDKELEFAKSIQCSSLPSVFPPYPNRTDFDIYAQMTTAKEVGGDFYDFYLLSKNKLAFLIADVSGKGIPAAMFMMTSKTLLKSLMETGMDIADAVTAANAELCKNNDAGMFVTAWMGIMDLKTGLLTFVNAGHNPPILCHADGTVEFIKVPAGFVLAGMDGIRYKSHTLQFNPGDKLFLYTDGVTEATDAHEQLYGEERLLSMLENKADTTCRSLYRTVSDDVSDFVGEAPQFDDITVLIFQYRGNPDTLSELTVDAIPENIEPVTDFVNHQLDILQCPPKARMQIDIAVDELFGNIARYAYPGKAGQATIHIAASADRSSVSVTFIDSGIPFDPLQKADPDITLSAEDRAIGGLGIYTVKKCMDNVTYHYHDGHNILTITKTIK